MKQLKTAGTMLLIIVGIAMLIAAWYVVVAVVVLFVTYYVSKSYITVQEVLNEPTTN